MLLGFPDVARLGLHYDSIINKNLQKELFHYDSCNSIRIKKQTHTNTENTWFVSDRIVSDCR